MLLCIFFLSAAATSSPAKFGLQRAKAAAVDAVTATGCCALFCLSVHYFCNSSSLRSAIYVCAEKGRWGDDGSFLGVTSRLSHSHSFVVKQWERRLERERVEWKWPGHKKDSQKETDLQQNQTSQKKIWLRRKTLLHYNSRTSSKNVRKSWDCALVCVCVCSTKN